MIGICPKCGNHQWDKEVKGNEIFCPKCGNNWKFTRLPLFILSGCSGVGKTTTAMEIIRRTTEFTVLDADMFYNIMPHETDEDYFDQAEQIGSLSKNHNSRFFPAIYCLALVCDEELLRARMRNGRGITDEEWIQSSVDYNHYFKTHRQLGDMAFDTWDISGKTPAEAADYVIQWVAGTMRLHKL